MRLTAWAYRAALRAHDLGEQDGRLAGVVLEYSYELPGEGRYEAWFPTQRAWGLLARVPASNVSQGLARLRTAHVLSERSGERGLWVALQPPGGWRVKLRQSTGEGQVAALEKWLGQAVGETPWLLPPPVELAELLREDFAQSRDDLAGSDPVIGGEPDGGKSSLRAKKFAESELAESKEVCSQRTFGAIVVPIGSNESISTESVRKSDPNRTNRSEPIRQRYVHSPPVLRSRTAEGGQSTVQSPARSGEYRQYVEGRLFEAIGWEERAGPCARRWQRFLDYLPEQVDELLSTGLELKRNGQLRQSLGAFLNGSLGKRFDEILQKRK